MLLMSIDLFGSSLQYSWLTTLNKYFLGEALGLHAQRISQLLEEALLCLTWVAFFLS